MSAVAEQAAFLLNVCRLIQKATELRFSVEPIQFATEGDTEAPGRRRQDRIRATVAAGCVRRSVAELTDMASRMEVRRKWYEMHEEALKEYFGQAADLFRRLLSITPSVEPSQQLLARAEGLQAGVSR